MYTKYFLPRILLLLLILLLPACSPPAPTSEERPEWGRYYEDAGVEGAFVLFDPQKNLTLRYNPEGCARRRLPASTFKVLNALIGLESGVIPGEDYVIPWDGISRGRPEWNQDHTLASAMRVSAVWYYQELARRVGPEEMQRYVDLAGYGNRDISGGIDSFWLTGGLAVSPDEQVDFLRRLYEERLPFSERSMQIVKRIIVLEATDGYTLSGKSGWTDAVYPNVGWFVGYVEKDGGVVYFANAVDSPGNYSQYAGTRESIARQILAEAGVLPE